MSKHSNPGRTDEEVPAATIKPGDHFWTRGHLHLADVVFTSEKGTSIASGQADLWFAPDATVIKTTWH